MYPPRSRSGNGRKVHLRRTHHLLLLASQGPAYDQASQFIKMQGQLRQAAPLRLKHALNVYQPTRIAVRRMFVELVEVGCREVNMLMNEHGFAFEECEWKALYPEPTLELVYPSSTKQNFVMALLYESIHEGIHPEQYKAILGLMPTMHKQMEGQKSICASSLPVLFFTAISTLTVVLSPQDLMPLRTAALMPLEINDNFRLSIFTKRNNIVVYNKNAGKDESAATMASDIFQSVQVALMDAQKGGLDSLGTYGSLLDSKLDAVFTTHVQEHGASLTDKQLTSFLMKAAEVVEFFLSKCPRRNTTTTPPTPAQKAAAMLTDYGHSARHAHFTPTVTTHRRGDFGRRVDSLGLPGFNTAGINATKHKHTDQHNARMHPRVHPSDTYARADPRFRQDDKRGGYDRHEGGAQVVKGQAIFGHDGGRFVQSGKHKALEAGGCPPPAPKRLHVPDDNLQDAETGKFQQLLSTRCMVCLNEDHT